MGGGRSASGSLRAVWVIAPSRVNLLSCIPRREVLVEGRGASKHSFHGGDGRCIPRREVLVEHGGATEHAIHGGYGRCIPRGEALVEGRGVREHS